MILESLAPQNDKNMKIGIDARLYQEAGVGRYIRNLLANLQEIDHENQYLVFLLDRDFDKVKLGESFSKVRANFRWYGLAEQIKFPRLLNKYKLDLVHFPHFNVPIFYSGKYVVTIHDLIHQKVAMRRSTSHDPIVYAIKQFAYKKVVAAALKKSQTIITVSDFVKDELEKLWRVDSQKIVVTKEAVEENIIKLSREMTQARSRQVLSKFSVQKPFLFYVGNAHPHKNVEGLVQAFLSISSRQQPVTSNLQLVLAGHDHYFWERIKRENQHPGIVYAGKISDLELVAFYKSAEAFVMPSFEEGFGIPLLEAMACGCPVVSSNGASLPEVGGDACLYFNPRNVDDMVEKIQRILTDLALRKELVQKGRKRYQEFSWKELAEDTLKTYEEPVS